VTEKLPIEALRDDFLGALAEGPVVVSSPTGSGKSTQLPRWCPGRVLVVEPRRVACRSLAQRVAELEGCELGTAVGYHVRDERRAADDTRILFVTPGVALRIFDRVAELDTVILDEFHERSLDVDLLLALLLRRRRAERFRGRLVVTSATLDGERVASHVDGRHLHAEGRVFPVETRHLEGGTLLPDVRGVEERVRGAVAASRDDPGDVLVFLPGKGEIAGCAQALAGEPGVEVIELHGGLSLEEQSRAFRPASRRKVVLATNVAETSITLPGIGVVIDSGLVRRTRYHRDRGFLTLVPVAMDSAEQRRGRAGRTAPGVCYRLWSEAAQLEARTPPEIHRESLTPLVLASAACGERVAELPFLDPPKEHAVATARDELTALGGLDDDDRLTEVGRHLFGLPLDAPLSRLLVEARQREEEAPGVLDDAVDLVSVLSVGRPLFPQGPPQASDDDEPLTAACDAVALIRALRQRRGDGPDRRHPYVLREARATRDRLRRLFELSGRPPAEGTVDRRRLAMTVLAADPRAAHLARRRGRRVAWSNGGTEIGLGRESAVNRLEDEAEAIAVLDTRALGLGGRDTRVIATCAMPIPVDWLLEAGLGRDRLAEPEVEEGRAVARIERVYARRVLEVRREVPEGEMARGAVARLFLAGQVFPETLEAARDRLQAAALAERLVRRDHFDGDLAAWGEEVRELYGGEVPELGEWVRSRVRQLGVASGDDLMLLSAEDLLPPELPYLLRRELDREFPRRLTLPGAEYEIEYDVAERQVTLHQLTGRRVEIPSPTFLPSFPGFRIRLEHKGALHRVRGRR